VSSEQCVQEEEKDASVSGRRGMKRQRERRRVVYGKRVESLEVKTVDTMRLCERGLSCRLRMMRELNLFQKAAKAPCAVGEQ
jgi:hypothetical protein